MKLLLLFILSNLLYSVNYYHFYNKIDRYKLSTETICKNGYLTIVAKGKIQGVDVILENLYCDDISTWDGDCNSEPIKCYK